METTYKNFKLSSKLAGDSPVSGVWDKRDNSLHNHFKVSVKNLETGKRTSFDFYDSVHNYEQGVKDLTEYSLKNAFHSFVSDAYSGEFYSFDDFCNEFGYDTDSRSAEKTYKACKRSYDKVVNIGIDTEDAMIAILNDDSIQ